jgi:hypothetical protein
MGSAQREVGAAGTPPLGTMSNSALAEVPSSLDPLRFAALVEALPPQTAEFSAREGFLARKGGVLPFKASR